MLLYLQTKLLESPRNVFVLFVFVLALSRKLHSTRTDSGRSLRSSRPLCSISRSLLVNLEVLRTFRNIVITVNLLGQSDVTEQEKL